tara:strand:+ start:376 stop:525 length:150 start_codon:yes stop_codon:yes gene_type:complete
MKGDILCWQERGRGRHLSEFQTYFIETLEFANGKRPPATIDENRGERGT